MRAFRTRRGRRRGPRIDLGHEPAVLLRQRRAATLGLVGDDAVVRGRVGSAPPAYLISHEPADIARHCRLIDPRPDAGEVRVAVTPARRGWGVDVAGRDQPGLLAAVTGVLAVHDLDVDQAVIATWDDGAVLDAFVVRARRTPDLDALQREMQVSLAEPLSSIAVPDAAVEFDDGASPWYTRCDVHAPDRPGLFHALAVAITCADADVHGARATTADGRVHDRFDLTDATGHKLGEPAKATIRALVASGVSGARAVGTRSPVWSYEEPGTAAR